MESPPTNPPSGNRPGSSPRDSNFGAFLKFIGLMLTLGGSLAMIRTKGVGEHWFSGPPIFFVLLILIGLGVWGVGFYLCGKARDSNGHG